jgi:hypothetical protein
MPSSLPKGFVAAFAGVSNLHVRLALLTLNGSTLSLSSISVIRSSRVMVTSNRSLRTAGVRSKDGATGLAAQEGRRENDLTGGGAFTSASIYAVLQIILSSESESSLSPFARRALVPSESSLLRFEVALVLELPSEQRLMDLWMAPSTVCGNFIVDFAGEDGNKVDNNIGTVFSLPLSEL